VKIVEPGSARRRPAVPGAPLRRRGGNTAAWAPSAVAARLRAGGVSSDPEFDQIYDHWLRRISQLYWTPVAVARRAAKLLTAGGRRRVLDIGSGVGKFCIVGALTTAAQFVGVEQRHKLVKVARKAAARFAARRTAFVVGDFASVDFGEFDAFYLFNPFEELVNVDICPIDGTTDISPARYDHHVLSLQSKLSEAPRGARVLTYFGYGGPRPPGYRLVRKERAGSDALVLWQKE
jgi:SAM-dependent methyltransferase